MKPKTKSPNTTVSPGPLPGTIKISHHQSVRQSMNYQSAEVNFGVELVCADDPKEIERAIDRAEEIVENRLVAKLTVQQALLKKLG